MGLKWEGLSQSLPGFGIREIVARYIVWGSIWFFWTEFTTSIKRGFMLDQNIE